MASSSNPHHTADPTEKWKVEGDKYILPARGLNITWGKDSRYWRLPEKQDKNGGAAELMQVSWLEVTGSIDLNQEDIKQCKTYAIGLSVTVAEDAFGLNNCPVYFMAKIGKKGKYKFSKLNLAQFSVEKSPFDIHMVIDVSQPSLDSTDQNTIYFGLYEVWSGKWKGGLKIHHAFLKEVNANRNAN